MQTEHELRRLLGVVDLAERDADVPEMAQLEGGVVNHRVDAIEQGEDALAGLEHVDDCATRLAAKNLYGANMRAVRVEAGGFGVLELRGEALFLLQERLVGGLERSGVLLRLPLRGSSLRPSEGPAGG
jgi:hypothetical protein